jgi:4-amino-4-deoxy-L-arabinose transferase-like glycosyltransferase
VEKKEMTENKSKYVLAALCLCSAALSFLYSMYKNKFTIDELVAPVVVNIETDKAYMNSYRVIAEPNRRNFVPEFTDTAQNELTNAVVFAEIRGEYIQQLLVQCHDTENAIEAIDNITVFVGNKTHYFPKSAIKTWEKRETKDGILFQLPVEPYAKSIIKPWINWYGDLNFALKEITAFLGSPVSFPVTLACLLLAIALLRTEIATQWALLKTRHKKRLEIIMLIALLGFAFLLRINGFIRHSSWSDELYSSTVAANPNLPLWNTFKDPGNPPFFYLLLRFWHEIFGWSEPSGRMLGVVIGTLGVVSLYFFVKSMCGVKCAFLAALLLSVNPTHIGFSNEIRAYILQMALVPLVSLFFFGLLRKTSCKNYVLYILAGIAIVNTHYYGVLLIMFNFIYYIGINRKRLFVKKTTVFFIANIIIALSLLPFFAVTAFRRALMDGGFNSWMSGPGKQEFLAFVTLVLVCFLFAMIRRRSKAAKNISAQSGGLLDYAVYAVSFIFIAMFLASLKRPSILTWRYLSILLPLVISILPLAAFHITGCIRPAAPIRVDSFLAAMMLMQFSYGFKLFGGGNYMDTGKEAQEYMLADIAAHSLKVAELYEWDISYYGDEKIPAFAPGEDYDVVYINSTNEERAFGTLANAGLDGSGVLKIRITGGIYVWKKYLQ